MRLTAAEIEYFLKLRRLHILVGLLYNHSPTFRVLCTTELTRLLLQLERPVCLPPSAPGV